jgi:sugar transferase (PEP-CTERM/EpsH1 system associated)
MANILLLVHRLPYPPNKGDKVRSYHLLKHLAARHRVFLGTFIDDPEDEPYRDTVRSLCADACIVRLHPRRARLASLGALLTGEALTLRFYRDTALQAWVSHTMQTASIDAAVVFSSAMSLYVEAYPKLPVLLDLVDVDSAKWTAYGEARQWPMSWLYRREGARLLSHECQAVARASTSFLVTQKEVDLFARLAPELATRVEVSGNGVDADFFAPDPARPSPFPPGETALVFTGAMDYWPNVDAMCWFVEAVLPRLLVGRPGLRLHIVGRNPSAAVRALQGDAVTVSGTVPDVRPYLQHAAVVVAPLRLARGVQNKVLEAMAMARPVVAATSCTEALVARAGSDVLAASDAESYAAAVNALLDDKALAHRVGGAARRCVVDHYSWPASLAGLERSLESLPMARAPSRAQAAAAAPSWGSA